MKILLTGIAGFIGYHLMYKLKDRYEIIGLDSINDYYDIGLKYDRLNNLGFKNEFQYNHLKISDLYNNLSFIKLNLEDKENIERLFEKEKFDLVINLAAQAGVRASLTNPDIYINSNIIGFYNILECCKKFQVRKILFASSSSVYGGNRKIPFSESDNTDNPVSFYAVTKKTNEILAQTYYNLYNISTIGVRFFTVYGPYGRPDMAYYSFTDKILKSETIELYNYGKMRRDFTYIDDIIIGLDLLIDQLINGNIENDIFNIGNNAPVELIEFVKILEELAGIKAHIEYKSMQPGDVVETYADISKLFNLTGFKPKTDIKDGLKEFFNWYKRYFYK